MDSPSFFNGRSNKWTSLVQLLALRGYNARNN